MGAAGGGTIAARQPQHFCSKPADGAARSNGGSSVDRDGHLDAVIVRFLTSSDDGRKGEVLVVSRVTSMTTCHMAYIDALANPEGMALARRIADEQAATFDCSSEPVVEGHPGQSPL